MNKYVISGLMFYGGICFFAWHLPLVNYIALLFCVIGLVIVTAIAE